jgi:hypothetical protein
MRGGITRVLLEALGVKHAALAAVEGEHIWVEAHAGEALVDDGT